MDVLSIGAIGDGSSEKKELEAVYAEMHGQQIDVPMYIGSNEVRTDEKIGMHPPHEHAHSLGTFNRGTTEHVQQAIDAALAAKGEWASLPWEHRAAIFLKAADLLAGPYRAKINAATMLAQSKNAFQAEIDAACELIDFFKFNVFYMQQIYMPIFSSVLQLSIAHTSIIVCVGHAWVQLNGLGKGFDRITVLVK